MSETDNPGFRAGPPPEASRYFRNRGIRPSFSFEDVAPEEHAVAFSAAKAMRTDVVTTLRDALQEALDEGTTLAEFQRTLTPRLQELGWWGVGDVLDDAGTVIGQGMRGSPRRLRTIFRANMRTARAAGQWERIERTADALPYLVYLLGPSRKHRPEHEAKEGMVLSVDDPFWEQWMPPNGWGCKCHVRQITRREAGERGISETPEIGTRPVRNISTGQVVQVPDGIDPGWQRNPGMLRFQAAERFLEGRLTALDDASFRVAARDIATSWRAQQLIAGNATGTVPIGRLPEKAAEELGASSRIISLGANDARKIGQKHPEVTDLAEAADLIHAGRLFRADDNRLAFVRDGDDPRLAIVKRTAQGDELYLNSIYRPGRRYIARRMAEWVEVER